MKAALTTVCQSPYVSSGYRTAQSGQDLGTTAFQYWTSPCVSTKQYPTPDITPHHTAQSGLETLKSTSLRTSTTTSSNPPIALSVKVTSAHPSASAFAIMNRIAAIGSIAIGIIVPVYRHSLWHRDHRENGGGALPALAIVTKATLAILEVLRMSHWLMRHGPPWISIVGSNDIWVG